MVTTAQIRQAANDKDWHLLRQLHDRARTEGIDGCSDEHKLVTINLQVIECSLFRDKSPAHLRTLAAMLDAIDRGNHPYDDALAMSTMEADAAIAQAQINAQIGKG